MSEYRLDGVRSAAEQATWGPEVSGQYVAAAEAVDTSLCSVAHVRSPGCGVGITEISSCVYESDQRKFAVGTCVNILSTLMPADWYGQEAHSALMVRTLQRWDGRHRKQGTAARKWQAPLYGQWWIVPGYSHSSILPAAITEQMACSQPLLSAGWGVGAVCQQS